MIRFPFVLKAGFYGEVSHRVCVGYGEVNEAEEAKKMYYFDNSATTQPLPEVLQVYAKVAEDFFANPSSAHRLGERSRALMDQARDQIGGILGFKVDEIYFTSSGTEANNWVFQAVVDKVAEIHPDRKQILISAVEHPATMAQIPLLEAKGFEVHLLPVDDQGVIDLGDMESHLSNEVLLVSTMAVNNEVGATQPLSAISHLLSAFPQIIWHVDGVQAVTCQLDLLLDSRIDLVSLSAHKFHSVRGVGILAKRQRVASRPFLYGGGQEGNLRSSTENLPGIVATAKALRIAKENQAVAHRRLSSFRQQITPVLQANGWEIFAQAVADSHIICAALPPYPGEVLLHAFEAQDVYVSTTSACSSRKHQGHTTLRAMGVASELSESAIRFSLSQMTVEDAVTYLCRTIQEVSRQLKG